MHKKYKRTPYLINFRSRASKRFLESDILSTNVTERDSFLGMKIEQDVHGNRTARHRNILPI